MTNAKTFLVTIQIKVYPQQRRTSLMQTTVPISIHKIFLLFDLFVL